jgi:F-type H+-transporting ATPase subunit epsilon
LESTSINLEIVSPDRKVYSGEVKSVSAPGIEGGFQVLSNHAPYVTTLGIGKIKIESTDGSEIIFAISGGIFEVSKNKATILAESIESQEEINADKVKAALARAEELLKDQEISKDEKEKAKLELEENKNKLKVVKE